MQLYQNDNEPFSLIRMFNHRLRSVSFNHKYTTTCVHLMKCRNCFYLSDIKTLDLPIVFSRFFLHCVFFCQRLLPNLKLMLRLGVAVLEKASDIIHTDTDTGLDMVIIPTMLLLQSILNLLLNAIPFMTPPTPPLVKMSPKEYAKLTQ